MRDVGCTSHTAEPCGEERTSHPNFKKCCTPTEANGNCISKPPLISTLHSLLFLIYLSLLQVYSKCETQMRKYNQWQQVKQGMISVLKVPVCKSYIYCQGWESNSRVPVITKNGKCQTRQPLHHVAFRISCLNRDMSLINQCSNRVYQKCSNTPTACALGKICEHVSHDG